MLQYKLQEFDQQLGFFFRLQIVSVPAICFETWNHVRYIDDGMVSREKEKSTLYHRSRKEARTTFSPNRPWHHVPIETAARPVPRVSLRKELSCPRPVLSLPPTGSSHAPLPGSRSRLGTDGNLHSLSRGDRIHYPTRASSLRANQSQALSSRFTMAVDMTQIIAPSRASLAQVGAGFTRMLGHPNCPVNCHVDAEHVEIRARFCPCWPGM